MRKPLSKSVALALAVITFGIAGAVQADDSPMKTWMKANMGAARASNDFPGLVKAFDKVAASNPDPTWSEWAPISKQGSAAAKAQDMRGVKDSCNACHQKYKDAYKAKYASRPFP